MRAARRCGPPRRPAGGLVLVALLSAVLAIVLLLAAGWNAAAARRAEQAAAQRQQRAQQLARERLADWYRAHLAELDAPGGLPPDPAAALAGLPAAAGFRLVLGELQVDGEVSGRALQLAGAGAPGLAGQPLVDGSALERAALVQARRQLRELATRLEVWFRARIALDPLHRRDRNYYRPADPACLALPGELPCLPDYTDISTLAFLPVALGLDAASLHTPWGPCCPIEASNGVDASVDPPYSLALRIRTPWNTLLQARAVQTGGAP